MVTWESTFLRTPHPYLYIYIYTYICTYRYIYILNQYHTGYYIGVINHLELLWHLDGHHLLCAQLGSHEGQQAAA